MHFSFLGVDKLDVQEITEMTYTKANALYDGKFTSYKLLNGYRRFEPSRGMEYVVDLDLKVRTGGSTIKRFHLLRPLGKVEIVPMPYVTETIKVNLIIPLFSNEIEEFGKFFHEFDQTVLQTQDESFLYVIFIYVGKSSKDVFASAKATMEYYAKANGGNGAKMAWKAWQTDSVPNELEILDHALKDFRIDSLVAMVTPGVQMEIDYLNRVRLNTIGGTQVFFPITFWQYKTNLAYDGGDVPTAVELSGKYGHFDIHSYEHFSFYVSDYYNAKKSISAVEMKKFNTFNFFLKFKKLHIFRAAEPALRHRWKNITCDNVSPDQLDVCHQRSHESLASRSQLAKLIFEYEDEHSKSKNDILQTKLDVKKNVPRNEDGKSDLKTENDDTDDDLFDEP